MTGHSSSSIKRNFTDILVVGAGPAGLNAALSARDAGATVTLIDKATVPGNKACAGGLTRESTKAMPLSTTKLRAHHPFLALHVITPKGRTMLSSIDGAPLMTTIDRPTLQDNLLEMLRDRGGVVYLQERLLSTDTALARTASREIPFGHLIGADGVHSRIRRFLGLEKGIQVRALALTVSAATGKARGIDTEAPTVWFDTDLFGAGYAWSFPFGETLRLGIGVAGRSRPSPPLRALFNTWLTRIGLKPSDGVITAGTIGCGYAGYRFGNIYLAGDAAGLASPLTGEGIAQALVSGKEVAREITTPAYRSDRIAALATRHRRTLSALSNSPLVRLLDAAPRLLEFDVVRRGTLRRFVY